MLCTAAPTLNGAGTGAAPAPSQAWRAPWRRHREQGKGNSGKSLKFHHGTPKRQEIVPRSGGERRPILATHDILAQSVFTDDFGSGDSSRLGLTRWHLLQTGRPCRTAGAWISIPGQPRSGFRAARSSTGAPAYLRCSSYAALKVAHSRDHDGQGHPATARRDQRSGRRRTAQAARGRRRIRADVRGAACGSRSAGHPRPQQRRAWELRAVSSSPTGLRQSNMRYVAVIDRLSAVAARASNVPGIRDTGATQRQPPAVRPALSSAPGMLCRSAVGIPAPVQRSAPRGFRAA